MYTLLIKAKNIEELKSDIVDIHNEFVNGKASTVTKTTSTPEEIEETVVAETIEEPREVVAEAITETETVTTAGVELDSQGLPWDKRIHAGSKLQNKDGSWKKRKGVDALTFETIKAELLGNSTQPVMQSPVVETPVQAPVVETPVQAPVVETPAPAMPTVNMNAGHTVETFSANFAQVVSTLLTEGKIDQSYITQLCEYFGVANILEINDVQKGQLFESLVQYGKITKVG